MVTQLERQVGQVLVNSIQLFLPKFGVTVGKPGEPRASSKPIVLMRKWAPRQVTHQGFCNSFKKLLLSTQHVPGQNR